MRLSHRIKEMWRKIRDAKNSNPIIAICTAIIAAATIFYCGVTLFYGVISFFQWRAISDANRINSESIQSVQRAFVSIGPIFTRPTAIIVEPKGRTEPGVQIFVNWQNNGNTPAINAVSRCNVNTLPNDPMEKIFIGTGQLRRSNIAAHGPMSQALATPISFFRGSKSAVLNPYELLTHKIFLWGWVVYRDVFPQTKPHLTEFCQQVVSIGTLSLGDKKRDPSLLEIIGQGCEQHNCTDEYCDDYDEVVRASMGLK